ncbi:hypothetical protein HOD30_05505 [Candidatus Peregrinibacteria bacterium]|jgi:shikimate kinase|nr:hypothetical protein [Candidatus Peregrinibacteria bacterium]MBT4631478.1 hypothetical protein [Candidatus Peregrinibacteria bacterium]MBT5516584.1 hypothetical protein [Candidatus Peregrinibacteria bacterium]MBT5823867.1 hypothetical protein [Candidatus Peregrinibacteria bacterium]
MIVLIGFKHVGKTSVGKALAKHLDLAFADLDELIAKKHNQIPREIVLESGEDIFHMLEGEVLEEALKGEGVLALGGSTPLHHAESLKGQTCINITANKDQVFNWIIESGWPATFKKAPDSEKRQVFEDKWQEAESIYKSLATHTVYNHNDYQSLVKEIEELL